MIISVIAYVGLVAMVVGLLAIVRPLRLLGLPNRKRAALVFASSALLTTIALALPAPVRRVPAVLSRLDDYSPTYQFNEVHSLRVQAPPERTFRAIRDVTASEISLFRLLIWIRRFGRSGGENILNPPDSVPILDVATRTGFLLLADDAPRELVIGTVVLAPPEWQPSATPTPAGFKTIHDPGFATAVMNFRIVPDGADASIVSTETRVFATDARATRRFAVYWRIIYPGSALIRRMWLRAIRRRAEGI